MIIEKISAPDLATVAGAGVSLQNIEAIGFSADGLSLLVRTQFKIDGDSRESSHYAVWLYDIASSSYTACLNLLLAPEAGLADVDIRLAAIGGRSDNLKIVAQVQLSDGSTRLAVIQNGVVVEDDIVANLLEATAVEFERISLDMGGRWLALQTSSLLGPLLDESQLDTNDASDVFLLDTTSSQVTVVSVLPDGFGKTGDYPAYLGSVHATGSSVQIAFASQDAFVGADKNGDLAQIDPTDAYLWSSATNTAGLTGTATVQLVSRNASGAAVGGVDPDSHLQVTNAGVYFSSSSPDLGLEDDNSAVDAFLGTGQAAATPLLSSAGSYFSTGSSFVSSDSQGGRVVLLTTDPGVVTVPDAQQVITQGEGLVGWENISGSETIITDAVVSPNGTQVAYSTYPEDGSDTALYLASFAETTPAAFDVTVTTTSWKNAKPISDVGIAAEIATDTTGTATLADQPAGDLTLTPSKTASTTDKAQVNLLDAIAILKSIVGLTSLNPNQQIAANFDGNAGVDLNDAIGILKHVVGLPSATPKWVFTDDADAIIPASGKTISVSADTTVALTGILVGDVDGSWAG